MPFKFYNRKNKAKWVLKMDAGLVPIGPNPYSHVPVDDRRSEKSGTPLLGFFPAARV
ncbi:hypothetical protein FH972_002528 [Carpinus fangiana]|uniref:Uncharacterized protein n=1 Tax=Carpinus fangiana TaxID=176857 RepID=A0A5N6QF53_9ROSI|nr:hypothetical protein FH972_002528 [Carpinus fangiana]